MVGKSDFNENPVVSLDLDFGLRLRVCQKNNLQDAQKIHNSVVFGQLCTSGLEIVTTHGHAVSSRFLSHQLDFGGYPPTFVALKTVGISR